MPDVTRSDSQRSDTSLRPRVSFNRDVHVKRIVPREGARVVGALSGDGNGHPVAGPVRKERLNKSKKQLAQEAAQVLHQADKLNCVSKPRGVSPEKFYTLPTRRKEKQNYPTASLDRRRPRRNSLELPAEVSPKKPQRTFVAHPPAQPPQKASVFDIFKKKTEPKKAKVRRSVSDASTLKSKNRHQSDAVTSSTSDREDINRVIKKQLSPIIEVTQREDYFTPSNGDGDKENNSNRNNIEKEKSVTEQLKEYIDEVDEALHKENKAKKDVEVVIIDLDKAEKISSKKSKLRNSVGKKLKSITTKKNKTNEKGLAPLPPTVQTNQPPRNPRVKEAIKNLKNQDKESPKMIHSSQKPADKLPLTKGRTVDSMVRRLNNDTCLPPPKPNVMVIPNVSVQHNNNQPFSYTRGLSPEKYMSDENLARPIIYAQVVCNNGRPGSKQTVHTAYSKKQQNSDSDEGLGNEDTSVRKYREKTFTHFGDDVVNRSDSFKTSNESPIMPKYRVSSGYSYEEKHYSPVFVDSSARGRADGMDAKRRESLSEQVENELDSLRINGRSDLSARRDLLESRINRRISDNNKFTRSGSSSPSPIATKTTKTRYYKSNYFSDNEPKSFDSQISDYRSSPENKFETSHRAKNLYKSTPDIYHTEQRTSQQSSFHDSLRRERHKFVKTKNDKDKFGDSGIENDIMISSRHKLNNNYGNDSEDEGFASSLLIASERQHTEENLKRRLPKKEYDSDRAYSGEDDSFRHAEHMEYKMRGRDYVPRERSIDDGSHFDPRIDKEFRGTLKNEKKPPKPEKKSSLEKMKQLFSRDPKKKKNGLKQQMVREESLRARYTEYKGSRENLVAKKRSEETTMDYDYSNRRRLSTPSPSPTRETNEKPDNTHTSWFKSLDRLSRKKNKKEEAKPVNEEVVKKSSSKSLRFFGDTDMDSGTDNNSSRVHKTKSGISHRTRSQSTRDLHNISENPELTKRNINKSMVNISESSREIRGSRSNLKPPASPNRKIREPPRPKEDKTRRGRKYEISSVESSTEGDSSQQSQRSIVYLHAATVGDIPGPSYLRNGKRAASREELASNDSRIQPQVKTLSRSFSVLAPWKPRHYHEGTDIDYSQQTKPTKFEQKSNKNASSRKENSSTLKKKAQDMRRSNQNSTLSRTSKSKENLSKWPKEEKGSSSTLYRKKERLPRENSRYTKERDDKKKSMSVESLSRGERKNRDISRSISMPKDPEKSAGWFKKKPQHRSEYA